MQAQLNDHLRKAISDAAKALRFLAGHTRPDYAEREHNAEDLFDIVERLENGVAMSEAVQPATEVVQSYEQGIEEGVKRAFDLIHSAAANSDNDARNETLYDIADDVLAYAPKFQTQWLEIKELEARLRKSFAQTSSMTPYHQQVIANATDLLRDHQQHAAVQMIEHWTAQPKFLYGFAVQDLLLRSEKPYLCLDAEAVALLADNTYKGKPTHAITPLYTTMASSDTPEKEIA